MNSVRTTASLAIAVWLFAVAGCSFPRPQPALRVEAPVPLPEVDGEVVAPVSLVDQTEDGEALEFSEDKDAVELLPTPPPEDSAELQLDQVIESVRLYYPLLRSAFASRDVAAGETLSALGEFDTKLKAASENQPLGFYENYRHRVGVERNTIWGGEVFAGYRIGRGEFEPWYLERETNDGGEFKAGFLYPLVRNQRIDARRAALWRAQLEQQRVEPAIQAELLLFVQGASFAYWEWVAAGQSYEVAQALLDIANTRNEGLTKQVDAGERAEIELKDNERLILSREALLIDARRKLQQSAIKLSLFLRQQNGAPLLPTDAMRPESFPKPLSPDEATLEADIQIALANRPELAALNIEREQLNVELRQARNLTLPEVYGGITASDDVGGPTSPKKDKSETVLESKLFVSVPLERRKARGKIRSLEGKLAQLSAKTQFTADKIVTDIRAIRAAIDAAYEQIDRARESSELAAELEKAEQRAFELGNSDLLSVNLRELQAADAANSVIKALLAYYQALADYRAAIAAGR